MMVEKTPAHGWLPDIAEPFRALGSRIAGWFAPRSEASGDTAAYRVSIELPGVAEDDMEVTLRDGILTVKGEKRAERREEGAGYFFTEREYGRFERSFRLPADADPEKIEAEAAKGVLTVTIGRKGKGEEGRTIPIRAPL
ncbi:Hsp20/alpha crystallin family protein [Limibaculum sp. FT325]|uniref:Hsp20/alpha crystallin family protein n=1 Tax=Thermohalobaculum sediminis TaxID=2939436 RepID=UPI0020BFB9C2|nr:Hsp20/alpha crystallin family protein [Limibaculum sediminis]MCL5776703.1 Hsp20/alpha crystallin family protein [Limibaculum sediminis]